MTADEALRMSVLNAVLAIENFRAKNPEISDDEAAQRLAKGLASEAAFNYETALSLIRTLEYPATNLVDSRPIRLRSLIKKIIVELEPEWRSLIPIGRRYLFNYFPSSNIYQCFENAGLYETPANYLIIKWWDDIANIIRTSTDESLLEIGRKGESLTMTYERTKLIEAGWIDFYPELLSLEDNSLGYDVRSYNINVNPLEKKFIEVKATNSNPLIFYVTKNEWRVALSLFQYYVFHIWHVPSETLVEIPTLIMSEHIPDDKGRGAWQEVRVSWPLST